MSTRKTKNILIDSLPKSAPNPMQTCILINDAFWHTPTTSIKVSDTSAVYRIVLAQCLSDHLIDTHVDLLEEL